MIETKEQYLEASPIQINYEYFCIETGKTWDASEFVLAVNKHGFSIFQVFKQAQDYFDRKFNITSLFNKKGELLKRM